MLLMSETFQSFGTCGILKHNLSFLDLQGNEVMFFIEASIIEEKPAVLQGSKSTQMEHRNAHLEPKITNPSLPGYRLRLSHASEKY